MQVMISLCWVHMLHGTFSFDKDFIYTSGQKFCTGFVHHENIPI